MSKKVKELPKKKNGTNSTEEPKQLNLDIKEPFKNKFYKAKRNFDFAVLKLEVIKFLKDPLVWSVIIWGGCLSLFQINSIITNIEKLPTLIPLFKFFNSPRISSPQKNIFISSLPLVSLLQFQLSFPYLEITIKRNLSQNFFS